MQITITVDDELVLKAAAATRITSMSELFSEALGSLVYREAARGLIALGGSQPDLEDVPRRRPAA